MITFQEIVDSTPIGVASARHNYINFDRHQEFQFKLIRVRANSIASAGVTILPMILAS